ncbi:MAG: radical SAM protein [Desulfonatronovibrio sp.]
METAYTIARKNGLLEKKIKELETLARDCTLCPRQCRVNRLENETGFCNTGSLAQVASYNLHFGEEAPLTGRGGSGTVFFAHCNLGCVFCQNFDISSNQSRHAEVSPEQLADIFLELQASGAENINLVTPSHVVLQILQSLLIAAEKGLNIPLVYNTGSYDELGTLRVLEGIVDIYLADSKFFDREKARKYAGAPDYPVKARAAVLEMHRQVGSLVLDENARARRGLMIRHLVMPGDLAGSKDWLDFFAANLPDDTYLNIMEQYRPAGNASGYPELQDNVPGSEITALKNQARALGLKRLDKRSSGLFRMLF